MAPASELDIINSNLIKDDLNIFRRLIQLTHADLGCADPPVIDNQTTRSILQNIYGDSTEQASRHVQL
jgi:hypothetical protein